MYVRSHKQDLRKLCSKCGRETVLSVARTLLGTHPLQTVFDAHTSHRPK